MVYDCGCGEQQAQIGGADDPNGHEASGQTITFDCSSCTAPVDAGPYCSVSVFQHGDHQGWEAEFTDGDYDGVAKLVNEMGIIKPELASDLAKLEAANIPVDITFKQGKDVLGL